MQLTRNRSKTSPTLDITPLIDVVFLLLVFLLLTMTFSQDKSEVEEAIIDIELAQSSTTQETPPTETLTLLIDENGTLYRSDAPTAKTKEDIKLYLSEKLLSTPELNVSVKADHRAQHGQVIDALDLLKELGIKRVNLVIEKAK